MTSNASSTRQRGHAHATGQPTRGHVGLLTFLPHLAMVIIILSSREFLSISRGSTVLSVSSCLFTAAMAVRRGRGYLIPSSVFLLGSGIFVGLGAYYVGRTGSAVDPSALRDATALALSTTIGISFFTTTVSARWNLDWPSRVTKASGVAAIRPPKRFQLVAILLLVVSQIRLVQSSANALASAAGLAGIMMIVLAASSHRVQKRSYGDWFIVVLAVLAPIVWVVSDFSGGGRITIAGIGIASFLGWNLYRPLPGQKMLLILIIPLFLLFAGRDRLDRGSNTASGNEPSASSVIAGGAGLASVYSPLESFGMIIEPKSDEDARRVGPRYGETFLNTALLPIPRDLWPSKPQGFGAELVEDLEIQGVSDEHSMAALIQGEWYANFGYPGLVLMMPVMGYALALLDRSHAQLVRSKFRSREDWWAAAALLCCVASLADLYWVGTFTWFSRGGLAAVVVYVIGRATLRHPTNRRHRRSGPERATQRATA